MVKDTPVEWTEDHQKAFEKIIILFRSAPTIQSLNCSLPFKLICDASDYAAGAILG